MIRVQDHIASHSGTRDGSKVVDEVNALQEFDKMAIYLDYFIVQSFKGFKPYSFDQFKIAQNWNENIYAWYLLHFQKSEIFKSSMIEAVKPTRFSTCNRESII